jgi:kynurenine formamidase
MKGYRLVDLSLPLMNGGGFRMPAEITYFEHRTRGKMLSENFGINLDAIGGKSNAIEQFTSLTCHAGTHFDAPWHYDEIAEGKKALTVDQVPLEWCFGDGVWIDLSWKKPGEDITDKDVQKALEQIGYTLKPMDIVLIKTGASAYYGQPGCDEMNAGMTREATLWLGNRGIRVVGTDAGIWDRPIKMQIADLQQGLRPGSFMQGHRAAGEKGMCIIEWLTNLDELPHFGFKVYAFPIKVQNAGAGWVRTVAFVPD